jgi:hypothetical protein
MNFARLRLAARGLAPACLMNFARLRLAARGLRPLAYTPRNTGVRFSWKARTASA